MRIVARMSVCFAALALAAPLAVLAQAPAPGHSWSGSSAVRPSTKSWFGRGKMCAECQREQARASHGANVPPPPALPGATSSDRACASCGGSRMVLTTTAPVSTAPAQGGYGGVMYGPGDAPGYATTDGGPSPVGEFRPQLAGMPMPMPNQAGPGMAGTRDSSVGMSSYSPTPLIPPGANRPRILSHLFGFSEIGRDWREARARRGEESHAAIRMGIAPPAVDALPARMVYGR